MSFVKTLATLAVGFAAAKGVEKFRQAGGVTGMKDALRGASTGQSGMADQMGAMADKYGVPGGADAVRDMFAEADKPDAIFVGNDHMAFAVMDVLRFELGLSVPGQVAIAGFNDLTGSDQMLPTLTTVRTPRAQIGQASAQMLLSLMRGEEPEVAQLDLGFEIIQRLST